MTASTSSSCSPVATLTTTSFGGTLLIENHYGRASNRAKVSNGITMLSQRVRPHTAIPGDRTVRGLLLPNNANLDHSQSK